MIFDDDDAFESFIDIALDDDERLCTSAGYGYLKTGVNISLPVVTLVALWSLIVTDLVQQYNSDDDAEGLDALGVSASSLNLFFAFALNGFNILYVCAKQNEQVALAKEQVNTLNKLFVHQNDLYRGIKKVLKDHQALPANNLFVFNDIKSVLKKEYGGVVRHPQFARYIVPLGPSLGAIFVDALAIWLNVKEKTSFTIALNILGAALNTFSLVWISSFKIIDAKAIRKTNNELESLKEMLVFSGLDILTSLLLASAGTLEHIEAPLLEEFKGCPENLLNMMQENYETLYTFSHLINKLSIDAKLSDKSIEELQILLVTLVKEHVSIAEEVTQLDEKMSKNTSSIASKQLINALKPLVKKVKVSSSNAMVVTEKTSLLDHELKPLTFKLSQKDLENIQQVHAGIHASLQDISKKIEEKDERIKVLEENDKEKGERIGSLETKNKALEDKHEVFKDKHEVFKKESQERIKDLEEKNKEKDERIESLEIEIESLKIENKEKDERIKDLEEKNKEKDKKIKDLGETVTEIKVNLAKVFDFIDSQVSSNEVSTSSCKSSFFAKSGSEPIVEKSINEVKNEPSESEEDEIFTLDKALNKSS